MKINFNKIHTFVTNIEEGAGWCTDNYLYNFHYNDFTLAEFMCLTAILAEKGMLFDEEDLPDDQDEKPRDGLQYTVEGALVNMSYYFDDTKKIPNRSFDMFSKEGNEACNEATQRIIDVIESDKKVTEQQIHDMIAKEMAQIHNEGFEEVFDTEPEHAIVYYVKKAAEKEGYAWGATLNRFGIDTTKYIK